MTKNVRPHVDKPPPALVAPPGFPPILGVESVRGDSTPWSQSTRVNKLRAQKSPFLSSSIGIYSDSSNLEQSPGMPPTSSFILVGASGKSYSDSDSFVAAELPSYRLDGKGYPGQPPRAYRRPVGGYEYWRNLVSLRQYA